MDAIIPLIIAAATAQGIDPTVAVAVAWNESRLNPSAIGSVGEVGLFQIRPEYSKVPRLHLFNPRMNVEEGVRKLAEAKRRCKHQRNNSWLTCYNAGVTGGSRIVHGELFPYVKRVNEVAKKYDVKNGIARLRFTKHKHERRSQLFLLNGDVVYIRMVHWKWEIILHQNHTIIEGRRYKDGVTYAQVNRPALFKEMKARLKELGYEFLTEERRSKKSSKPVPSSDESLIAKSTLEVEGGSGNL